MEKMKVGTRQFRFLDWKIYKSVILNVAEGSGKSSEKELSRYLDIAMGSLYETLANADTMRLNKLISEYDFEKMREMISGLASQIGGFKKKIRNN